MTTNRTHHIAYNMMKSKSVLNLLKKIDDLRSAKGPVEDLQKTMDMLNEGELEPTEQEEKEAKLRVQDCSKVQW